MDLELALDAREAQGKANRRLRRQGIVPGVVFGKDEESTPVQVDAKTFETLYRSAGRTSVVKLRLPGGGGAKSAVIKEVQRNPLTGSALHVDFFVVNLKQEMEVEVPLTFTGAAPAVEETGGSILHNLSHVRVRALPGDLPHEISVDVSPLVDLDAAIHVRDLVVEREKVHIVTNEEELVAKVLPPRVEPEPEVVAEEEAAEEAAAEAAPEEAAEASGEAAAPNTEAEGA